MVRPVGGAPPVRDVLALQRSQGNRAVTGILQRKGGSSDIADTAVKLINRGEHRKALALFDFNWFTMKETLAYSSYRSHIDAMVSMVEYRKGLVDALLRDSLRHTWAKLTKDVTKGSNRQRKAFSSFSTAMVEPLGGSGYKIGSTANGKAFQLTAFAAGSTTPTSDYDISFTAAGMPEYESDAVSIFNNAFREAWGGRSSGVVFDTNVYSSGFMPQTVAGTSEKKDKWVGTGEGGVETEEDKANYAAGKLAKHRTQLAFSLLPIRQHFGSDDGAWTDFCDELLNQVFDDVASGSTPEFAMSVQSDLDAVVELVADFYESTESAVAERKEEMAADLRKRNPKMSEGDFDLNLTALAKDTLYEDTLADIREILKDVQSLQLRIATSDDPGKLQREYGEKVAEWHRRQGEALVYANEAYFSGGPVKHVVLGMQGGGNIQLSRQEQMQSLLMNIGYKLAHYEHHDEEHGAGRATYSTAKYGERIGHLALDPEDRLTTKSGDTKAVAKKWDKDVALFTKLSDEEREFLTDEIRIIHDIKKSPRFTQPGQGDEASAEVAKKRGEGTPPEELLLSIAKKSVAPFYLSKWEEGGGWGGVVQ